MTPVLPKGLAGHTVGIAGTMLMAGHYLNPKFWPLIAASSPRAQGEFLRMFGKALRETRGLPAVAGKSAAPIGIAATTEEKEPEPTPGPVKRKSYGEPGDE